MWLEWERREILTEDWWENMQERDHFQDLGINKKILRRILEKREWSLWSALNWLRNAKTGGHF
jgi:replicative superfamily II helicase